MNVDRYITYEAVTAACQFSQYGFREDVGNALRAALPSVLARHRADVLAELGHYPVTGHAFTQHRDGRPPRCDCGAEQVQVPRATAPHTQEGA